ncbi:MAG: sulfatase-like hydrolase/transferase [Saprospiraceae bacterium]|nr:MAG: phosphoglycerol transferase family protein, alkaline phosphatase superfamily [Bacteroidetes bacterium OLB9]MCO6462790.1 sulfatase-like hydrolase/transferase [Saprospiraceae bacterium]MCZ2339330.1 sulfatase-like hydrolase/transferase [Chitinophagales bacterium]
MYSWKNSQTYFSKLRILGILLVALLMIYTVLRGLFIFLNYGDFKADHPDLWLKTLLLGLRFDLSAIFYTNAVYSLLWLLPIGQLWYSKGYQWVLKWLFIGVNTVFIFLNVIDSVYFPFVRKRLQSDALLFFTGDKGMEGWKLVPTFLVDFWYAWLVALLLVYILIKVYTTYSKRVLPLGESRNPLLPIMLTILIMGVEVIGMRGGIQLRPITLLDATRVGGASNIPYVVNSTFSLLRTWSKKQLEEKHFFDESQFTPCEIPVKTIVPVDSFQQKNVVLIIVESLSYEYISAFGGQSFTPFLDSLMNVSLVFPNGYANGRESVQGIPAVLASIPAWMDDPFIFSGYASNNFNSLASVLHKYGYTSSFFHGATTGSMGFYSFTQSAGFDEYFGKEDYPDATHFDGAWGIWDHHFLQFMADKLSNTKQPFMSAVLTLNSHHPFQLPDGYIPPFPNQNHPILNSIQYVDFSLGQFFKGIQEQPWYDHTIFVITADHTGPPTIEKKSSLEDYHIPVIVFQPDHSLQGVCDQIIEQIDIMPTLFSLLGINDKIFTFGHNVLGDTCMSQTLSYKSGIYQFADDEVCVQFDGERTIALFNLESDKALDNNRVEDNQFSAKRKYAEIAIKKRIQVYNHAMIQNKMTADEKSK